MEEKTTTDVINSEYHFNCVNRYKVIRRIAALNEEKKKVAGQKSNHVWSEEDLLNQIIGELQDLIY